MSNCFFQDETDAGVVTPSGVAGSGSYAIAVYTAASGTLSGQVRILVASGSGFMTSEFCSMNGDIATGHSPKNSDFSLVNFSASDANGNVISGLIPEYVADIQ